jgi:ABC-2 type transport system permease protein
VLSRYSNPVTVGLGLFFVTYLLGAIAAVNEQLEWLKYLSPFHYVQPTSILANEVTIEQVYLHIMLLTTITAILFAYWRYRRKDLLI